MRKFCFACLLPILGVALLGAPAIAAPAGTPAAPLGMIVDASNAHAGADLTYAGSTVYDGDHLATRDDGTMRLRLGTGQLYLHNGTAVDVHALPNGFSADVDAGTISASSAEGQTFQLQVDGVIVRPATSHATSAQIVRVSPTEAILSTTRGDLLVTLDDEVKTVSAGSSYKLEISSDESSDKTQGPIPAGRKKPKLVLILITAAAATTGYLIYRAVISPTAP